MKKVKSILMISSLVFLSNNAFSGEQLVNHAKTSGIKSCLSTISDVENFFTEGQSYGSWSLWSSEKPDEQIFNSTLEINFTDGIHLIDLTVAPTKDGQCSYSYTRTWYSDKSCMATSKLDMMKNAEYKTEINKVIAGFESTDNDTEWFLMPAGNGCIVQKKQVGFRYKAQTL